MNAISFPGFETILTAPTLANFEGQALSNQMDIILKQKRIVTAALSLRMKSKSSMGLSVPLSSDRKKKRKTRRKLSIDESGVHSGDGADILVESAENSPVDANSSETIVLGRPLKKAKKAFESDTSSGAVSKLQVVPSSSVYGPGGDVAPSLYGPGGNVAPSLYGPGGDIGAQTGANKAGSNMNIYGPGSALGEFSTPKATEDSSLGDKNRENIKTPRPPVDPRRNAPKIDPLEASAAGINPDTLPLLQRLTKLLKKGGAKKKQQETETSTEIS